MSRSAGLLVAALTFALASTAQAEVKDSSPSGFTIENSRVVPVDAAAAFKALIEDVDRWWPKDHSWWGKDSKLSIEPRAGGCFCESAGAQQALLMLVTFVDPGRTLRLVGGLGPLQGMGLHGVLEFRFTPIEGEGRTILMTYRAGGYTPDDLSKFAPVVDGVQAMQLGGLADFLGRAMPATPQ